MFPNYEDAKTKSDIGSGVCLSVCLLVENCCDHLGLSLFYRRQFATCNSAFRESVSKPKVFRGTLRKKVAETPCLPQIVSLFSQVMCQKLYFLY